MRSIGIMQGRLSPPIKGRIQAFPSQTWQKEFYLARDCGFSHIEWVLDPDSVDIHMQDFKAHIFCGFLGTQ